MKSSPANFFRASRLKASVALFAVIVFASSATIVSAAAWSNLEPFKSRRADVEQTLGQPIRNQLSEGGALQFKVAGGTITVAFVDAKFVETKKLAPELEGTIKEIILQHDHSSITPESLNLAHKSDFKRDEMPGGAGNVIYRNVKSGLVYTFIGGKLKTTYYTPSMEQLSRAQRKNAGR